MKKYIIALATMLGFGLLSFQLAAAGPYAGRGFGPGCGGCGSGPALSEQDQAAREQFYEETADLRKQLFELRQQYAEAMNADPVDKDGARELWNRIFDLQAEIRGLAADKGIIMGGPGSCLGPDGYYEGDPEKSSFRGERGYGRRGGRWSNI